MYLYQAFNLRIQVILIFQRLSRIYREFVWKAMITCILNNKVIPVNSKLIVFHSWYNAGVIKISDNNGHSILAFDELLRSFNIRTHFFQYYSLTIAIPNKWKKQLR